MVQANLERLFRQATKILCVVACLVVCLSTGHHPWKIINIVHSPGRQLLGTLWPSFHHRRSLSVVKRSSITTKGIRSFQRQVKPIWLIPLFQTNVPFAMRSISKEMDLIRTESKSITALIAEAVSCLPQGQYFRIIRSRSLNGLNTGETCFSIWVWVQIPGITRMPLPLPNTGLKRPALSVRYCCPGIP